MIKSESFQSIFWKLVYLQVENCTLLHSIGNAINEKSHSCTDISDFLYALPELLINNHFS